MIRLVKENWGYKLLALLLAGVFWLAIVDETEVTTTVSAPVQYRNVPRDLEILSDVEDRVQLEVRGPASKLRPANLAETVVQLDLAAVDRAGERTYPVLASATTLPAGILLERAVPSRIRLKFEKRMEKTVPVRVVIQPGPAEGYHVSENQAEPQSMTVVGPESQVKTVESVETDAVDASDVFGEKHFSVNAHVANPNVRLAGPGYVSVRIEVRKSGSGGN